jgi:O-acetyl-ADP-ribose deacetylase (regulator of RNase III)
MKYIDTTVDLTIEIVNGDLIDHNVDVFVYLANRYLLLNDNIGHAISKRAGDKLQDECNFHLPKHENNCVPEGTVRNTEFYLSKIFYFL